MGNSCYLNAALQTLCATEHLVEYFKEGLAQWEVNESNSKGYGGNLVARFDKLINDLTSGAIASFAPTELRASIAKKNSELCQAGQQQDSAEILAVILDGLHEDLNRADGTEKYEEFPDSNERSDAIVSAEHWSIHKKVRPTSNSNITRVVQAENGILKEAKNAEKSHF